jgi:hypothetical protein
MQAVTILHYQVEVSLISECFNLFNLEVSSIMSESLESLDNEDTVADMAALSGLLSMMRNGSSCAVSLGTYLASLLTPEFVCELKKEFGESLFVTDQEAVLLLFAGHRLVCMLTQHGGFATTAQGMRKRMITMDRLSWRYNATETVLAHLDATSTPEQGRVNRIFDEWSHDEVVLCSPSSSVACSEEYARSLRMGVKELAFRYVLGALAIRERDEALHKRVLYKNCWDLLLVNGLCLDLVTDGVVVRTGTT